MKLFIEVHSDGRVTGSAEVPSEHHTETPLPFGLSAADLVFLRHAQGNAFHRLSRLGRSVPDMYEALLGGTLDERNAARNAMDLLAVQEELSRFNADPAGWVAGYGGSLKAAYDQWISGLEA